MCRYLFATVLGGLLAATAAFAQYPSPSGYVPYQPYGVNSSPVRGMIASWYGQYLGRAPEYGAVEGWVGRYQSGEPLPQIQAEILGSQESYAQAGSNPQLFVQKMFQNVLGRAPTGPELNFWGGDTVQRGPIGAALDFLQQYPQSYPR